MPAKIEVEHLQLGANGINKYLDRISQLEVWIVVSRGVREFDFQMGEVFAVFAEGDEWSHLHSLCSVDKRREMGALREEGFHRSGFYRGYEYQRFDGGTILVAERILLVLNKDQRLERRLDMEDFVQRYLGHLGEIDCPRDGSKYPSHLERKVIIIEMKKH